MGDVFIHNPDGSLNFADRVKCELNRGVKIFIRQKLREFYCLIQESPKTAVVRASNERWGEVPIAFIACRNERARERNL